MTTYFVCSGAGATGSPYDTWNKAATSITALLAGVTNLSGPSTIYVHSSHVDNRGAAITWTLPETGTGLVQVLCVDGGAAEFPTGGSGMASNVGTLTTGAVESTNGNYAFTINGNLYCYGVTFKAGSNTPASESTAKFAVADASGGTNLTFENCAFVTNSTNGSSDPVFGGSGNSVNFRNCTFTAGATGQQHIVRGNVNYYGCSISGGSTPSVLFYQAAATYGRITSVGCDWSGATAMVDISLQGAAQFWFDNCKIGTPTTGTATPYTARVECRSASNMTSADESIYDYYLSDYLGTVEDDQTYYLTSGGAETKNGTGTAVPYSLKMTPTSLVSSAVPLRTPWITIWNELAGSRTISVKIAYNGTAVLNGNDVWLEVEFLETGSTLKSSFDVDDGVTTVGTTMLDVTAAGSARTDSGNNWSGTFANTQYNHTLTATVSIDHAGYLRARVAFGASTPATLYVDPKITVA